MARAIDRAGIHFRTLNASKGPAVRATRAQADRVLYRQAMRGMLDAEPNLTLLQQTVERLLLEGACVRGVVTQAGLKIAADTVVLTVGTFLDGKIHVGEVNYSGGRAGDPAVARPCARSARSRSRRRPPEDRDTAAHRRAQHRLLEARSRSPATSRVRCSRFSAAAPSIRGRSAATSRVRRERRTRSSAPASTARRCSAARSKASGPRYCPSIEDKVVRFADRERAPDLHRARGTRRRTRSIRTASRRACRSTCSTTSCARSPASSTPTSRAPAMRSSTTSSTRAICEPHARDQSHSGDCISPGRSTARRATRRRPRRASWPASTPPARARPRALARRERDEAYIGVLMDDLVTRGTSGAVSHVHEPRGVSAQPARGQRRPPAYARRA